MVMTLVNWLLGVYLKERAGLIFGFLSEIGSMNVRIEDYCNI